MATLGRRCRLDMGDPTENRQMLAEQYCDGLSRRAIADIWQVHPDTISDWLKKPEVQAQITIVTRDLSNRVARHVNSRILGILENPETLQKLSVKDLLDIRKEFASGGKTDLGAEDVDDKLWEQMDNDPEFARKVTGLEPTSE